VRVTEDALGVADTALREAADSLHAASATVSPPSVRLQAARSRSATAGLASASPSPAGPGAPAPADQITRGR
jgi:hypothetical protein